ncbi:HD domain-containing protein [Candidatus Spongiihabitans sp.]|uniref:HD domain-containing protein n=1 Tax=Candidatus Spongiihabitans sp. TaxID=3101308 RepID=UPI003C7D855D
MKTVAFAHMADGTAADYALLAEQEKRFTAALPARLMRALEALEHSFSGYRVSRLEHSLQSATRAHDAGEEDGMVAAALLHDIGDALAPVCHSEMAAAILRPYVSERIYWIVKHHGLFQLYYYAHYFGQDRNARDRYKNHRWYQDTVDFCENYDQNCFDPDFKSKPLAFFKPMVERVFAEPLRHFV